MVIDPTNTNIIYIATGDGYGYEATWQSDNDFWGGVYSAGVLKSTDYGVTWTPTGLSYLQESTDIVQKLWIHPTSPNILLAATRNGVYRTDDGGDTWSLVKNTHCYDFENDMDNPDRVYTVGDKDVFVSTDAGANWTTLKNDLCGTGRMSIESTADDGDMLYCLCENGNFFQSTNDGSTWNSKTSPTSATLFWGYYDMAFDVSNVDADLIFAGGLEVVRSTNGGTSWNVKSQTGDDTEDDYVHADSHAFAAHPTNSNKLFTGNDGGVFQTLDKGTTWADRSDGLRIAQAYRLSTSALSPDRVLSGWQDNGTNYWNGTSWEEIDQSTWDGMEAIIDYTDDDRMYLAHQYGDVKRTTNGGLTWTNISDPGGDWLTPYIMDPVDHMIMYYGDDNGDVHKSTNGGTSWTNKNSNMTGGSVFCIAVAPSNTNYVYACTLTSIKVSENGGDSWTTITGTLPHTGIGFNYIAVSNTDPEHVYVVLSGYGAGDKVFESNNAGASWTNISGTLPNVPVNCVVYENVSPNNRVYIGTDIGVFTKDDLMADWEPYMTGLPNVMVHELEINYTNYKLYAATYGRGIWRSDLAEFEVPEINTTLGALEYCPGESINVAYSSTGTFGLSNIFTAQLSDATGGFISPVNIGTLASDAATGVIPSVIPAATTEGTAYRVRVISSTPAITGTDNGADVTIRCPSVGGLSGSGLATTAYLTWDASSCGIGYQIEYRPIGTIDWMYATTTETSITLSGLLPNTGYEWAVQVQCSAGPDVFGDYSAMANFNTTQNAIITIPGINDLTITPNPFHEDASLTLQLSSELELYIALYDVAGQLVREVYNGTLEPGMHVISISAENLSKGAYTLRLRSKDNTMGRMLILE
ncbi:MAG: fibronectin type III domain-containing protein [Chitinophagales bacterium]